MSTKTYRRTDEQRAHGESACVKWRKRHKQMAEKQREKPLQTETNIGGVALIHFLSYSAIYEDGSAQTGAREKNESPPR